MRSFLAIVNNWGRFMLGGLFVMAGTGLLFTGSTYVIYKEHVRILDAGIGGALIGAAAMCYIVAGPLLWRGDGSENSR